ncbi:meiosis-specific coiled-coil domain-containing protein MEIOC-like [Pseudophryne corroboree]|uniref:meiosis-specific coiled-coil domain-containing protein MEIOC-like n=1 Tax=Pseudophryne corroboree TaxID=495146 RepID=UPI003081CBE1
MVVGVPGSPGAAGSPRTAAADHVVDCMIQSMDHPLLSQFVNGITSAVPPPQSKLYSSWSVCEDDAGTPSIPDCKEKSALFRLSENSPNMFGLMTSFPEESNKLDGVTDWDSLSRLFPPLWAANDHQDLSEYLPGILPENVNFSSETCAPKYQEQGRKLPDMESLQRGFEDLGLLESWVSCPDTCTPQLEDILQDLYIENQSLEPNSSFHPMEAPNQAISDYLKFNGRDPATKGGGFSPSSQKRAKEFPGIHKPLWKNDKGRGTSTKTNLLSQSNYASGVREDWGKEAYTKPCNDFSPLSIKPPAYHFNQQFAKERSYPHTTQRKHYKEGSENNYGSFSKFGNFDGRENNMVSQIQSESFARSSAPGIHPNEDFHPSSQGHRWLDSETTGIQKPTTSPLPSPASSTVSDGSPTHHPGYFCPIPSVPPSMKEGPVNGTSNQVPFSNFTEENQRRNKSFNHSSPCKEGVYRNMPPGYPPNWSPPQQSSGLNSSDRYHKLPKKTNPPNSSNAERRGRRSWNSQHGNVRQNPPTYNLFQRKQDPNVGNMSDFINASFLPPFSLMSDLKQNQNFPPFNPQAFSPPTNMPFPPPPLPFSDLIDLFHYEDLNRIHPFISDLFCGEVPTPYFPFPAPFNRCRPSRNRSGPANELHLQLEECCEQWRALEKERKKTEGELARNFPGNRISSSYSSSVPRLPTNPSRVDRLVVDQFREQARAISLVKIMENIRGEILHVNINLALDHHLEAIHLTQARRKDEIVNAANRQKQGAPRYNNERDVLALAAAMKEMVSSTRKARTALWCALQMTLPKSLSGVTVKQEDLERALQELCPNKTPTLEEEACAEIGDGRRAKN